MQKLWQKAKKGLKVVDTILYLADPIHDLTTIRYNLYIYLEMPLAYHIEIYLSPPHTRTESGRFLTCDPSVSIRAAGRTSAWCNGEQAGLAEIVTTE